MANKYYRQNLRNGTPRKSNIAKIMETFGNKKKVKKPKKRMFANKGGGADSGRMGEIKSKVTLLGDQIRKLNNDMGISKEGLTKKQIEKLKEFLDKNKNKFGPKGNVEKFMKPLRRIENPEAKPMRNLKKGGRAALKKGSKFPDHSGDGKITQKDILMAKGVIPKKKNKKKVI
jgi:hypothetical protein